MQFLHHLHPEATYKDGLKQHTEGSAGYDLEVRDWVKQSDGTIIVATGVFPVIPRGFVGLLFPRSSLWKRGYTLTNSVGVIDSDYRGEIKVSLTAAAYPDPEELGKGERIAQLVLVPSAHFQPTSISEEEFATYDTDRGDGGFGSTGQGE